MTSPIELRALRKSFGTTVALDSLDLTVEEGRIHGFLGPNGAGKSTTLRVLLGLLRPDGGTARLFGGDAWRDAPALHRRLAYVPGDVQLWPNLTGGETIDLLGRARGGLDTIRREELLALFDLDPTKRARSYSKGNRQKVALVAALASDVELLLLDEPTSGLDPVMELVFIDHLRRVRREGRTILLSSHILSEVEEVCDDVSIVKAGRVVESGTLDDLRHLARTQVTASLPADAASEIGAIDGVHEVTADGDRLSCQVDHDALAPLMSRLGALGVLALTCSPPTLEDLFMRHYDGTSTRRDLVEAS